MVEKPYRIIGWIGAGVVVLAVVLLFLVVVGSCEEARRYVSPQYGIGVKVGDAVGVGPVVRVVDVEAGVVCWVVSNQSGVGIDCVLIEDTGREFYGPATVPQD